VYKSGALEICMSGFTRLVLTAAFMPFRLPAALRSVRGFRDRLYFALTALIVPPAAVAGLYLYGSGTGCSGGDCTGPMMGVLLLGVLAVPVMLSGLFILAGLGLTVLGAWVRRRFEGEATWPEPATRGTASTENSKCRAADST
jgi:hypothetical protein